MDEAIAEQLAEALEEAHDRGIVNRDLKPANVKVISGGKVTPLPTQQVAVVTRTKCDARIL